MHIMFLSQRGRQMRLLKNPVEKALYKRAPRCLGTTDGLTHRPLVDRLEPL